MTASLPLIVVKIVAFSLHVSAGGPFQNMNGEYLTTPTPGAPEGQSFNTKWAEYPGGVEYFEARAIIPPRIIPPWRLRDPLSHPRRAANASAAGLFSRGCSHGRYRPDAMTGHAGRLDSPPPLARFASSLTLAPCTHPHRLPCALPPAPASCRRRTWGQSPLCTRKCGGRTCQRCRCRPTWSSASMARAWPSSATRPTRSAGPRRATSACRSTWRITIVSCVAVLVAPRLRRPPRVASMVAVHSFAMGFNPPLLPHAAFFLR